MRSPVTALWLLVEFSAQGIDRDDLIMLLRFDISGLVRSKLAIGMLLPMIIAVGGAVFSIKTADNMLDKLRQRMPRRRTLPQELHQRNNMRMKSFDLDIQDAETEFDDPLHLNDYEQHVCLTCFRTGLLVNTCLTVGVGAAVLPCQ